MGYIEFVNIERPTCTVRIPKGLLTDEQIERLTYDLSLIFPAEVKPQGVLVCVYYDRSGMAIFDNELDALRLCVKENYDDVVFWEFGEDWSQATTKPKPPNFLAFYTF